MKFAIFGDLHFCTMANRNMPVNRAHDMVPDFPRYAAMEKSVRQKLFELARQEKPDFVVSTGDLIEGGADSPLDMANANKELAFISPEIYRAIGSHDLYPPRKKEFFSFEKENSFFIFLDYTAWNEEQKNFLISELEKGKKFDHVFVFGHPPLYLLARHFFHAGAYADDVRKILSNSDVDIYFCGHTHNQSVSRHGNMIQIVCSSVGYADSPALPLESFHNLGEADEYFWGFPEDYQPGFWIVDVTGDKIDCFWKSLDNQAEFHLPERFGNAINILPRQEHLPTELKEEDLWQIQCAWLNIFSAFKGTNDSELFFNGISIGSVPNNFCYAARRFVMLPQNAISSIRESNELEIRFPSEGAFALGSVSLDLLLLDGRRIRSKVSPELFSSENHIDFAYADKKAKRVSPSETQKITIKF